MTRADSTRDTAAPQRRDFPPDFRWGCATASYQVEGAAHADGKGESIWDRFCTQPGAIRDGSSGAVACDHFHRWPQDLDLARDLGVNAYRFSVAWPRIFPAGRGAAPNAAGLDFYSRLVDGLLERGIEPWLTLYHWDLPQPLQDAGGWAARATLDAFAAYVDAVTRRLGDRVKRWITQNEPWCVAMLGHHEGVHAPGRRDLATALQVAHHVLLSHGQALPIIRANVPDALAGITLSLHPIAPAGPGAADAAAAFRHDGLRNRWFLDPLHGRGYPADVWQRLGALAPTVLPGDLEAIARPTDFLGINYYFPEHVADAPGHGVLEARVVEPGAEVERTGFGWEVAPDGLVRLLDRVQRDYRPAPIVLTENGATYDDVVTPDGRIHDAERQRYLQRHVAAAREVLARGIALQGYFAWSLLDNFEWAEGYLRRFGLIHVDYATQQRTLKDSGLWYRDFLRA
ncbi:MAG: beta-glucosidase [Proteobacteria bacterium]|nr:beta-glucosidase [Pseudomonadota bacterium]